MDRQTVVNFFTAVHVVGLSVAVMWLSGRIAVLELKQIHNQSVFNQLDPRGVVEAMRRAQARSTPKVPPVPKDPPAPAVDPDDVAPPVNPFVPPTGAAKS